MRRTKKTRAAYKALPDGVYHFVTDKVEGIWLFRTDEEFVVGMNLMALCQLLSPVTVYRFVLMGNHMHVLLKGTGADCLFFFDAWKHRISAWRKKSGLDPLPEELFFKLVPVTNRTQFMNVVLYIDRNPFETNMNILPSGYPWGTGYLGFSQFCGMLDGVKASACQQKRLRDMLQSKTPVPGDWLIWRKRDMVLPESYVQTKAVERTFGTAVHYLTRLSKAYEAFVEVADSLGEKILFSDTEVNEIVIGLCRDQFSGVHPSALRPAEKERCALMLSDRYRLAPERISRHLQMPETLVRQLLRSKKNR